MAGKIKVTEAELWEEVLASLKPPKREPGEKTVAELATETDYAISTISRKLVRMVRDGKLERRQVLESGQLIYVYRPKRRD